MEKRTTNSLQIVYNERGGQVTCKREIFVRNRGYKYVVKKHSNSYLLMCINATWINQMLKDNGIKPREFRKLTYLDMADVQTSAFREKLFLTLKPKNFWEMCDTLALSMSEYDIPEGTRPYETRWFCEYPLFTLEDVYEILLDKGMAQEDALRVMEFVRRGKCTTLSLSKDEFLQLYDVPEKMQTAIKACKFLPAREQVMDELIRMIGRAVSARQEMARLEEQDV